MVNKTQNDGYSIVRYKPYLFSKVMKMFNDSAGEGFEKTSHYFRYNLSKTPFGIPSRYLMIYKGFVVGSHSSRPLVLKVKNKQCFGGLLYNTRTHHEHRKKGIFLSLAKKNFEEAKEKKFDFLLAFSNENSKVGYEKLGMKELPINFIRIKNLNLTNEKTAKVLEHYFPRKIYGLDEGCESDKKFSIKIQRSEKYLLWRYKKNPEYRYLTSYKKGEYFFVYKKYFNSLHIIDFLVANENHYELLINTAKKLAKDLNCKELNMWIPKSHQIFNYIEKDSITYLSPKQYMQLIVFKKTLKPLMYDIKNWFYTMGDSNVF